MEFKKKDPLIILVAGKARSGKSTLVQYLNEYFVNSGKKTVISPYTKYLKLYIEEITNQKMDSYNKPRDLLQQISSKVIKEYIGDSDFFIRRQMEDIQIYSYFMDVILVPDVRFPKEIEKIREHFSNVVAIKVNREDFISDLTEQQKHDITEIALDNYHDFDFEIINNEFVDLKKQAEEIYYTLKKEGKTNE